MHTTTFIFLFSFLTALLLAPPSRAAGAATPELFHPVQFSESVGRDRALLTLDPTVVAKLLHSAKKGDPYLLFLPGGPIELRFSYRITDSSKDLSCCSIGLQGEMSEAVVRLNHALEVRDFEARIGGETYHYRASGNGNFEVLGPRAAVLPPETLR